MSKPRNYNDIDWSSFFIENEDSSTRLTWKVNRMSGMYLKIPRVKEGDDAGFLWINRKLGQKYFKVTLNGVDWLTHRIIWILHNGTIEDGYVIDHIDGNTLNNTIKNLRKVKQVINIRNSKMYGSNTSGNTGVRFTQVSGRTYVAARWQGMDGMLKSKYFNCKKLGLLESYAKACSYRESMIVKLNHCGANYSDRHGT